MFPYHDENQTRRAAFVTMLIIGLNVVVWLLVQGADSMLSVARSVCELGLIPGELTGMLPPGARFPLGEGIVCLTDPGRQVSHVITSMLASSSRRLPCPSGRCSCIGWPSSSWVGSRGS
jgi:hypothetical protein